MSIYGTLKGSSERKKIPKTGHGYEIGSGWRPLNFDLGWLGTVMKPIFVLITRGNLHDALQVGHEFMEMRLERAGLRPGPDQRDGMLFMCHTCSIASAMPAAS